MNHVFVTNSEADLEHEFALWIERVRFPERMVFADRKAVTFIKLECLYVEVDGSSIMEGLRVNAEFIGVAFDRVPGGFGLSSSSLVAAFFGEYLAYLSDSFLWDFGIPQRCVFAFAKFRFAGFAFQVSNLVFAVGFDDFQVLETWFAMGLAVEVGTG
jgi:hypothetical protein